MLSPLRYFSQYVTLGLDIKTREENAMAELIVGKNPFNPRITGGNPDFKAAELFTVDPNDGEQLGFGGRTPPELAPTRAKMLAILDDAIKCLSGRQCQSPCWLYRRGRDCPWHDAVSWVTEDDPDNIYGFDSVCETLGMDPAYVRNGILRSRNIVVHRNVLLPHSMRARLLLSEARKFPFKKRFSASDLYGFLPDVNPAIIRIYARYWVKKGIFLSGAREDGKLFLYPTSNF